MSVGNHFDTKSYVKTLLSMQIAQNFLKNCLFDPNKRELRAHSGIERVLDGTHCSIRLELKCHSSGHNALQKSEVELLRFEVS